MMYNNKRGIVEEIKNNHIIISGVECKTTSWYSKERIALGNVDEGDDVKYNKDVNGNLIYLENLTPKARPNQLYSQRRHSKSFSDDNDDPDLLGEGLGYSSDVGGW